MLVYKLDYLLHKMMREKGYGGKEITVHLPNIGSAVIKDIVWHEDCNSFHIILETKKCEHRSITWKGPEGNRIYTCDGCGLKGTNAKS